MNGTLTWMFEDSVAGHAFASLLISQAQSKSDGVTDLPVSDCVHSVSGSSVHPLVCNGLFSLIGGGSQLIMSGWKLFESSLKSSSSLISQHLLEFLLNVGMRFDWFGVIK